MRALLAALVSIAMTTSVRAQDHLASLSFLNGCWRGVFEGAAGVTDERCYTPMLGGRYLRETHVVRGGAGAYSGETIYAFDAESGRISYSYFASDGGGARGFALPREDGVAFEDTRYVDPDGSVMTLRASLQRIGDDRFVITTEGSEEGMWRVLMRIDFARAPDLVAHLE